MENASGRPSADPEIHGEDSASLTRKARSSSASCRSAFRPAAADTDTSEGAGVTRVIAFANQKGGVAKTTSTLNLAVAFAEQGLRVVAAWIPGEPHDEPGAQSRHDRSLDVRRARPPAADRAGAAQGRSGSAPSSSIDLPRRRVRPLQLDRPRARSRERARAGQGRLRLDPHRHAALARTAHHQRASCLPME